MAKIKIFSIKNYEMYALKFNNDNIKFFMKPMNP